MNDITLNSQLSNWARVGDLGNGGSASDFDDVADDIFFSKVFEEDTVDDLNEC